MSAAPTEGSVIVGRILGPWGIKGWVQIFSYTDPPTGIFEYSPWQLEGQDQALTPIEYKRSGKRLVVQLPGIDSPEAALKWVDKAISVDRSQLPKLPNDEFYWHDLVGLRVVNKEGHLLGQIKQMLSTGAHDVMDIEPPSAGESILIPFVQGTFVDRVSLDDGELCVDWPIDWLER